MYLLSKKDSSTICDVNHNTRIIKHFVFFIQKMEATTDLFINIIRNHRIIYDTTSKDFKHIYKKEDEWAKIALESRMSGKKTFFYKFVDILT